MFDFEIGGSDLKPRALEGIINIPSNRTLLALQLTQNEPVNPEIIPGLTTVEAVFGHFKPEVEVELESLEGMPTKETIRFRQLADFQVKEITARSPFLQSLNAHYQNYTQISRRLKGHAVLQSMLRNPETKAALLETMRAAVDALTKNTKTGR